MKKYSLLIIFLVINLLSHAQVNGKMNTSLQKKLQIPADPERVVTVLIKGDIDIIKLLTITNGGTFNYAAGDIASITIKLKFIPKLAINPAIKRIEDNDSHIQPLNDHMLVNNRVSSINDGTCLGQDYDGSGVVIGIIDTGIDWSHPDFKNLDSTTRIKYIWDQRQSDSANTPTQYNYGQEWNSIDINLGFCTSLDVNNNSHGTICAGIAAGNGLCSGPYRGVAPKADIIVVAINFADNFHNTVDDAVDYIYKRADSLHEPCVINASLGGYFGSHDGNDLQAQFINNLITADSGRAFVCAAGNEGGFPFHLGYTVNPSDTSFTWLTNPTGNVIDIWGDTGNFNNIQFSIGADTVDLTNNIYSFKGASVYRNVNQTLIAMAQDTIRSPYDSIIAIVQSQSFLVGGTYNLQFNIIPHAGNYYYRLSTTDTTAVSARFDAWNFRFYTGALPSTVIFPPIVNYKLNDTLQTICSSFQCSDKTLTVASYNNRDTYTDDCTSPNIHYNNTIVIGDHSSFSSNGPTRTGLTKPDITSPGEWVISSGVLSEAAFLNTLGCGNGTCKIVGGGCDIIASGTSMASPSVAGIAALYFQRNPGKNWSDVKNCIINNARTADTYTGPLPNTSWGYGKIDACATLHCTNTGINQPLGINSTLNNYPNPFTDATTITFDFHSLSSNTKGEIVITDILGNEIKSFPIYTNEGKMTFDRGDLQSGLYFYSLKIDGKPLVTRKMVVL